MTDDRSIPPGQRPKVEPEIIPPGARRGEPAQIWLTGSRRGAHFVHVETRGLRAVVLALLVLGVVGAALLALLLGVVLLWIPLTIGFAAALALSWLFRGRRR
jgi:hypothetical protein